jgi:IS1 family transposase
VDNCKKKQKKVKPDSPTRAAEGDAWIYTCLRRRSYVFVAFSVGKWTQSTCQAMMFDVARRLESPTINHRMQFFSDGNDDYTYVLPDHFRLSQLDYAQLVKIRVKGTLVGKEKRIVYGSPSIEDIETTDTENFNGILRERIGRLVRKTKCFSKTKPRLIDSLHIFHFYWNFMNNLHRGVSPAMMEGLANRLWTWHELFYSRINYSK